MLDDTPALLPTELDSLAIFPLPGAVLFPGELLPLHVFEPRYREMTRDVLAGDRLLAVARLRAGFEADYERRPPVYPICGVGQVVRHVQRDDGRFDILLRGLARARIVEEQPPTHSYRLVRARKLEDQELEDQGGEDRSSVAGWRRQVSLTWRTLSPRLPLELRALGELDDDEPPGVFADRLAAALLSDPDERQRLLEELDPALRLAALAERIAVLRAALSGERRSDLN